MNKKSISLITIITIILVSFSGCSTTKNKETVNINTTEKNKQNNVQEMKTNEKNPLLDLKYDIESLPADSIISFNTPWAASPHGGYSATIEGKGDKAQEEGYSHIIIKENKTGVLKKLTLENESKLQLTAKAIEWIDDNNMFVIIGVPFGTITMGGKIYKVNIVNGEASLYKDTLSSREEFVSIHKTGNNFIYEKHIYDDNNYIKGHNESGTLK